jgi:glycosyltransferase involved in cell wall biosynthesis
LAKQVELTMEVLLVSGIWPPDVGGPASHGPEFGRYLVDRGHRVRAVTTSGPAGPVDPGFPVVSSRNDRPRPIRLPASAAAVLAQTRGVEVIYSTGMYGRSALASALRRIPLVLKLVNDPAYERARRMGLFTGTLEAFQQSPNRLGVGSLRRFRQLILRRASRIVVPSHYLARIARAWGIPEEQTVVVPNLAPPSNGSTSREELRQRLDVRFPTFVFAGRLAPQKNLPLAISALSAVPQGTLVVIGDGVSREELMRAIARYGVDHRVALKGTLPRAEALEWLRAADAAILPSDWENFPHAAVEALAAGTPVIATAVGGVPEIVETGVNGLLVPPGDAQALGRAMASVAADGTLLACLRQGAVAAGERYRPAIVYAAIEAELKRAASGL